MELPTILIGGKLSVATRHWLKHQPIRFIEKPFTRVQFRKPNVAFFNTLKNDSLNLIVTSSYAAHWLVRFQRYIDSKASRRVFCVSERQRDILKSTGFEVLVSPESNMLSLAELVAGQEPAQTLYFRGDKVLNDLFECLLAFGIQSHELEVYRNTPIETLINEVFDAYLFFSPAAIDSYTASGNFPSPKASIMTSGKNTAERAWTVFPNTVNVAPDDGELSFVQFSVDRLIKSLKEKPKKQKLVW